MRKQREGKCGQVGMDETEESVRKRGGVNTTGGKGGQGGRMIKEEDG